MAHFRTTTAGGNKYLQYVKAQRNERGQPATVVLASLGNITNMSEEEIERLTSSFIRVVGMDKKFQMGDLTFGKSYHYGTILPVISMWHRLGIGEIIDSVISKKVKIPVSRIALIQIFLITKMNNFICITGRWTI